MSLLYYSLQNPLTSNTVCFCHNSTDSRRAITARNLRLQYTNPCGVPPAMPACSPSRSLLIGLYGAIYPADSLPRATQARRVIGMHERCLPQPSSIDRKAVVVARPRIMNHSTAQDNDRHAPATASYIRLSRVLFCNLVTGVKPPTSI